MGEQHFRTSTHKKPDWDAAYAYWNVRGPVEHDRTRPEGSWRVLPFSGAELDHLSLCGNPKDAVLRACFADGRVFEMPASSGRTHVRASGGLAVETTGMGETQLVVSYRPLEGHRLVVVEAGVDYAGGDSAWDGDLAMYLSPDARGIGGRAAVESAIFELRGEPR